MAPVRLQTHASALFVSNACRVVSIIVVFTKVDLLYLHVEDKVEKECGDGLDDDEFAAKVEQIVDKEIETRCRQSKSCWP